MFAGRVGIYVCSRRGVYNMSVGGGSLACVPQPALRRSVKGRAKGGDLLEVVESVSRGRVCY